MDQYYIIFSNNKLKLYNLKIFLKNLSLIFFSQLSFLILFSLFSILFFFIIKINIQIIILF